MFGQLSTSERFFVFVFSSSVGECDVWCSTSVIDSCCDRGGIWYTTIFWLERFSFLDDGGGGGDSLTPNRQILPFFLRFEIHMCVGLYTSSHGFCSSHYEYCLFVNVFATLFLVVRTLGHGFCSSAI